MTNVIASISMSLDGYVAGPDASPSEPLGEGGERLHCWVFGGPWTYDDPPDGEPKGEDAAWLGEMMSTVGAVLCGRWTYEAAERWGEENRWGMPVFVVTHRAQEEPPGAGFTFVDGVEAAVERARAAADGKDVHVMGCAEVIRQALAAGLVYHFSLIVGPVILGAGKRLFEGFDRDVELEQAGVRQSAHATFIDYRVRQSL